MKKAQDEQNGQKQNKKQKNKTTNRKEKHIIYSTTD